MVANMSDEEIWRLNRGGHDPRKVYAAYWAAANHKGQPTVILAKTVKGFGLGKGGEGQMVAHQQKKFSTKKTLRGLPRPLQHPDLRRGPRRAAVLQAGGRLAKRCEYLRERRTSLGGSLPARTTRGAAARDARRSKRSSALLEGTGDREISTTMAFVRILTMLLKDKNIGKNIVPIVPDEARTFGMEGLFRQIGIYSVGRPALHAAGCRDRSCPTARTRRARCSKRASTRRARCARGSRRARPTRTTASTWCRSTSSTRCSASSAWAISSGRRATSGARLPARRHRRPHHACGRRPAAPGRPQPAAREHGAELRRLRPDVCLRARRDHPRRPAPHVRRAGERLLLHRRDERELRSAGDAAGRASRASSRACTCCRSAARGKVRATLLGSGTILRECIAAAELLEKDYGVPVGRVLGHELQRAAPRGARGRALEPAASGRDAAHAVRAAASRIAKARSSPPPTTCASCRTRSASGCPAATSRSAPTASAARIARRAAQALRGGPQFHRARGAAALADEGKDRQGHAARRSRSSASIRQARSLES